MASVLAKRKMATPHGHVPKAFVSVSGGHLPK